MSSATTQILRQSERVPADSAPFSPVGDQTASRSAEVAKLSVRVFSSPLIGGRQTDPMYVGGDLSGGRWSGIAATGIFTPGQMATVTRTAEPLPLAGNLDGVVTNISVLYDSVKILNADPHLYIALKVHRVVWELFNNLALAVYRIADIIRIFVSNIKMENTLKIIGDCSTYVMSLFYVFFAIEFSNRLCDSYCLSNLLEREDAVTILKFAKDKGPESLERHNTFFTKNKTLVQNLIRDYEKYKVEGVVDFDKITTLSNTLKTIIGESFDLTSFEKVSEKIEELKDKSEKVRLACVLMSHLKNLGMEKDFAADGVKIEELRNNLKVKADEQIRFAAKVLLGIALGFAAVILSTVPGGQILAVAVAAMWFIVNMYWLFIVDGPELLKTLKDPNVVLGKLDKVLAHVRLVSSLLSVGGFIYLGITAGIPLNILVGVVALNTLVVGGGNIALFIMIMRSIREKREKEKKEESAIPGTPNSEASVSGRSSTVSLPLDDDTEEDFSPSHSFGSNFPHGEQAGDL